jgi:hypothetical protein
MHQQHCTYLAQRQKLLKQTQLSDRQKGAVAGCCWLIAGLMGVLLLLE